jgi:amidophosphoribosyltransferase
VNTDKLHEACGVFGVFSSDVHANVAPQVYYGLLSLQHRGQESAGIAAVQGERIVCYKSMGLAGEIFNKNRLDSVAGHAAIGHTRYSTSGASSLENAQPFVSHYKFGSLALAHNGTLTNAELVRELLEDSGVGFSSSSDSEVIVRLITKNYKKGLERALSDTLQFIKGSYALVILANKTLLGVRDPHGIRPLCLGKYKDGWLLASESCALDAVGAEFVRDLEPGEMVIITGDGLSSVSFSEKTPRAVCAFEYVYFARPDSVIDGVDVHSARIRAGRTLAAESPIDADMVIGVPDSGVPAAIGYSRATTIPFGLGLVKSKYVGRTFIAPDQHLREAAVLVKHNVIQSEVKDKRIILIDDSIVRGTTCRRLVAILKHSGARAVHIRVCSPPVRFPCYFGIDTQYRKELISNANSIEELCSFLQADSLAFISVRGLLESLDERGGYCLGCFTGEYPLPVANGGNS